MPVYTLASKSALSQTTRHNIANSITSIHCEITGAPPEFVSIIFMHGHNIADGKALGLIGNVRSGGNRNQELTDHLRSAMHIQVAQDAGLQHHEVSATLVGFPASWAMEGGEILPEPGDESAWLERAANRTR